MADPRVGLSLADCARPWALRAPGRPAVIHGGRTLSFGALVERIDRLGNAVLEGLGVEPGSHTGIMASNRLEYVELLLGLSDARVPPVQVAPTASAAELAAICAQSEIRVLFVEPALEEIARQAPAEHVVVLGEPYEALLSAARTTRPAIGRGDSDIFAFRYTSGTSGLPKASGHSHRSRAIQNLALAAELGLAAPGVHTLSLGSLAQGAGTLEAFAGFLGGGATVMLPLFHPEAALRAIAQHRVTAITGVPTHLTGILELGEAAIRRHDLSSLRTITLIGAPPAQALKERIIGVFGDGLLWEEYGSTEASLVTRLAPDEHLTRPGSAGLPFYGNTLRVVRDDGREAEPGEAGVLQVRSPMLFEGYWGNPEETAAVFSEGYFVTGDLASIDEEGYLYILSRTDDAIITGGQNVHPRQIEEVLLQHPAVADAGVFGMPDARLGEAIWAAVVLREGAGEDARSLETYLAGNLGPGKRPSRIELVSDLPKTANGKLERRTLKARYVA
jgi:acyl-CoA synthetase (AMP-forming)/AMP-acid ligase II